MTAMQCALASRSGPPPADLLATLAPELAASVRRYWPVICELDRRAQAGFPILLYGDFCGAIPEEEARESLIRYWGEDDPDLWLPVRRLVIVYGAQAIASFGLGAGDPATSRAAEPKVVA